MGDVDIDRSRDDGLRYRSMDRASTRTGGGGLTRSAGSIGLAMAADPGPSTSRSRSRTATGSSSNGDAGPSRLPHSASTQSESFVVVDRPVASTSDGRQTLRRVNRSVLSDGADADAESAVELSAAASTSSSHHHPRETLTVRRTKEGELRKINQYLRLEILGQGTHGRVWLCRDTSLPIGHADEFCALKEVWREGTKKDQQYKGLRANKQRVAAMHASRSHRPDDDASSLAPSHASLHEMDQKVRTEIAIMKRCNHRHIVKLREVINDSRVKKVFFILEYMAGGQIIWQNQLPGMAPTPTLTVAEARHVFRDLVLGLEYLHHQGIIHRDIKPANLLWETRERKVVKISDFGVSVVMQHTLPLPSPSGTVRPTTPSVDENVALRSSNGTFAFFAPELCTTGLTPATTPMPREPHRNSSYGMHLATEGDEEDGDETITSVSTPGARLISLPLDPRSARSMQVGYAIDVWAAGVTLYCLLFGSIPFNSVEGQFSYFGIIPTQPIEIGPHMGVERMSTEGQPVIDLLDRLLNKDPDRRATLEEVKRHPWLLQDLDIDSTAWLQQTDAANQPKVTVSLDEVAQATAVRTSRTKSSGRSLAVALKRAMDRFGFGRPTADDDADRVGPLAASPKRLGGRSRAHSSAAVSSSSASVPMSPITPAESGQPSPSMQRTVSGSSAGSHSPAIVRVPSQALRGSHLHPPPGRASERGGSESDVLSSPASKSPGPFKTLIGRMRSGSRAARPLEAAALDEQPILTDPEPPTPRAVPEAVPQAYSSRALRPVVIGQPVPAERSYSSEDYDTDEPDDDDDDAEEELGEDVVERGEDGDGALGLDVAAARPVPNSRFVPPHSLSDDADESDSEGGDDSLAFTFTRGRAERRS